MNIFDELFERIWHVRPQFVINSSQQKCNTPQYLSFYTHISIAISCQRRLFVLWFQAVFALQCHFILLLWTTIYVSFLHYAHSFFYLNKPIHLNNINNNKLCNLHIICYQTIVHIVRTFITRQITSIQFILSLLNL